MSTETTTLDAVFAQLSAGARRAVSSRRWRDVRAAGRQLLDLPGASASAEGHFLLGLAALSDAHEDAAAKSFTRALAADAGRHDAALELAALEQRQHAHGPAVERVRRHRDALQRSPRYLDVAGDILMKGGLPAEALPYLKRALQLQPTATTVASKLAACLTFTGQLEEAETLYTRLLEAHPAHPQFHYELSRLRTATDDRHITVMRSLVDADGRDDRQNVLLYYALGKELEDLERWDDAFTCYERGGRAAAAVGNYDVSDDLALIESVIDLPVGLPATDDGGATEIFIVGLPRSGSTLVERILSSHSAIESTGESFFVPLALRAIAGNTRAVTPEVLRRAATAAPQELSERYRDAIGYRRQGKPACIEKLPENFLYLGLIARSFPSAKLVYVRRNPMDNAFALFKQSYFRYAYRLDDLARYCVAHDRLAKHWQATLGERLVIVDYEALVADQASETRALLAAIGVDFESGCLEFYRNATATNTASSVQVREPIHSRSVGRWRHFKRQLEPLSVALERAGLAID